MTSLLPPQDDQATNPKAPAVTEEDEILITDFVNRTGDTVFDDSLKAALTVTLEESPYLNPVTQRQVSQTLQYMERPVDTSITPEVGQEMCERLNLKALMIGEIDQLGDTYLVTLNAETCLTGESLGRSQEEAKSKDDVINALGEAASQIRRTLGESLASIERFDTPLSQATTSSLEALRAFSRVLSLWNQGASHDTIIPLLERSIELDSSFALAYHKLGVSYSNLGEQAQAIKCYKRAFELSDRVSTIEKFRIETDYYWEVTGEIEKAIATFEAWGQTYARSDFRHNLAVLYAEELGQYEKGVSLIEADRLLRPVGALSDMALSLYLRCAGRIDEAKLTAERLVEEGVDLIGRLWFPIAFIQKDSSAMEEAVQVAKGGASEARLRNVQAMAAVFDGNVEAFHKYKDEAVALFLSQQNSEYASQCKSWEAAVEGLLGNPHLATEKAAAALEINQSKRATASAAFVLARWGDMIRVASLMEELAKDYPTHTLLHKVTLPTLKAMIELQQGNAEKAIDLLRPAARYEFGSLWEMPSPSVPVIGTRAESYLKLGAGEAAAEEYQKILDRRGLYAVDVRWVLAHLGLARAKILMGDKAAARKHYHDFFALWKDADSDIPILIEAKAEYEALMASPNN